MSPATKPATTPSFQNQVEEAIQAALVAPLEPADRIKVLAVAVRYLAVKAKLVTGEHGSAFDDDDDDDL